MDDANDTVEFETDDFLTPQSKKRYPKREQKPREFPGIVRHQAFFATNLDPKSVEEALYIGSTY